MPLTEKGIMVRVTGIRADWGAKSLADHISKELAEEDFSREVVHFSLLAREFRTDCVNQIQGYATTFVTTSRSFAAKQLRPTMCLTFILH